MAKYRDQKKPLFNLESGVFVAEGHPARAVFFLVDSLNLIRFHRKFKNDRVGRKAYPVKSMIRVLIYAYLEGIYSNRRIEQYCNENLVYRYLCQDDPPDHSTISRFWKRFEKDIFSLFLQSIRAAQKYGLVDYKNIAGDGVRISSMGSRSMLFNLKNGVKKLNHLNKSGRNYSNKKFSFKAKLLKSMYKLKAAKKRPRPKGKEKQTYMHITEPEARLMKKRDIFISGYNAQVMVDSKNHIILSSFVTNHSFDTYNGIKLIKSTQKNIGNINISDSNITLDKGYENEDLYKFATEEKLNLYAATKSPVREKSTYQVKTHKSKFEPVYNKKRDAYICFRNHIIPYRRDKIVKGKMYAIYERSCSPCNLKEECIAAKRKRKVIARRLPDEDENHTIWKHKLEIMGSRIEMFRKMKTEAAKTIYSWRLLTVEPVFAQIEGNKFFRRFSVWGLSKVSAQWQFVCTVHNIGKIIGYFNRMGIGLV